MNTYAKYCPNVWLAKTEETKEKGETILIANKYGREAEHLVHNLILSKDGYNYYSVERLGDTYAERKAKRWKDAAAKTEKKADEFYDRSNKDREFLVLAEPIKIGHHSERRHRKIIEECQNNTKKWCENIDKSKQQELKSEYWAMKAEEINLSSPESIDFFEAKLEQAKELQAEYKTGKRKQEHCYSLSYVTKSIKDLTKKLEIAQKLWS